MMNRSTLKKSGATILFGLVVCSLGAGFDSNKAEAQSFGGLGQQKRPSMEADPMQDKAPIKDLPEYTGKAKFFCGKTMKTSIGPQYQQQFIAQEDPKQVIDWYKTALTSYKWEVLSTEDNAVTGKKSDGARISVIVNPYHRPDGRSMVTINYNEYHLEHQNDPTD